MTTDVDPTVDGAREDKRLKLISSSSLTGGSVGGGLCNEVGVGMSLSIVDGLKGDGVGDNEGEREGEGGGGNEGDGESDGELMGGAAGSILGVGGNGGEGDAESEGIERTEWTEGTEGTESTEGIEDTGVTEGDKSDSITDGRPDTVGDKAGNGDGTALESNLGVAIKPVAT